MKITPPPPPPPHTHIHTHTHTRARAPEVVYGICCPGFPHCNCQTVNHSEQICINLVKLIHNLIIRSSLIIEKSTFKVFIGQLNEFQIPIWVKFQNRFVGTLKPMTPGL